MPVWDFFLGCNNAGLPIPFQLTPPDPAVVPNWMLEAHYPLMADEYLRYSDIPLALGVAQHHGLPTRLLDWTLNPVAAVFFAIEALSEPKSAADIAIWAIHRQRAMNVKTRGVLFPGAPANSLPIQPQLQIVRPSTRDNPYLAAQSGVFTTLGGAGLFFTQHGGARPGLEEVVVASQPNETILRKLVLSYEHVSDLIELLRREQVTRSFFMPTMDNVASDVRRLWLQRSLP